MYQYKCMNQIAQFGLDHFTEDYKQTENMEEADALLVRSAALHEDVYKRQTEDDVKEFEAKVCPTCGS